MREKHRSCELRAVGILQAQERLVGDQRHSLLQVAMLSYKQGACPLVAGAVSLHARELT